MGLRPGKRKRRGGGAGSRGWRRSHKASGTRSFMAGSLETVEGAPIHKGAECMPFTHSFRTLLGINPKIKPVELMSPRFIKELEQNKSPKAKASEMEHAIRKHCKVHLDEDPVLYQKLS